MGDYLVEKAVGAQYARDFGKVNPEDFLKTEEHAA